MGFVSLLQYHFIIASRGLATACICRVACSSRQTRKQRRWNDLREIAAAKRLFVLLGPNGVRAPHDRTCQVTVDECIGFDRELVGAAHADPAENVAGARNHSVPGVLFVGQQSLCGDQVGVDQRVKALSAILVGHAREAARPPHRKDLYVTPAQLQEELGQRFNNRVGLASSLPSSLLAAPHHVCPMPLGAIIGPAAAKPKGPAERFVLTALRYLCHAGRMSHLRLVDDRLRAERERFLTGLQQDLTAVLGLLEDVRRDCEANQDPVGASFAAGAARTIAAFAHLYFRMTN